MVSPHLTVEEAYLLCQYLRSRDPEARLVLGPVCVAGEDESFPSGFTIRAEKCPNRQGVERVLTHFCGLVQTMDDLLPEIDTQTVGGVWVSGGYKTDWIEEATAARFDGLVLLVLQDLFSSPLSQRADYLLPGAAFAEREGSYVNYADRLQSFKWAVRPPMGVQLEGRLFWQLLGREGMYNATAVLSEIAREITSFAAVDDGVPPLGIELKVNQLA